MHRSIAAGLAASLTSILFYRLDVAKTTTSLGMPNIQTNKGIISETISSFSSTVCYFELYEQTRLLTHGNSFISAAAGRSVSSLVDTPFSIVKKRKQLRLQVLPIKKNTFVKSYLLSISRGIPNTCLKYFLYENLLRNMKNVLPIIWAGGIAALIASTICTYILFPLDIIRNKIITNNMYSNTSFVKASNYAVLHSVLCNSCGHALLELWGPRSEL